MPWEYWFTGFVRLPNVQSTGIASSPFATSGGTYPAGSSAPMPQTIRGSFASTSD